MYSNYTELTIQSLMRGTQLRGAYILLLSAKDGSGFYPILLDKLGFLKVGRALNHHEFASTRLMNRLAGRVGMSMTGARITQAVSGQTRALIDFELGNEIVSIPSEAADAVVAALETNRSVWVSTKAFEQQKRMDPGDGKMALPLSAMNVNLLQEALESAVTEDNYELAIALRTELEKRNKKDVENS